ncbi:hypothetical protein ONS95_002351 [Cadophora gregata]|uniref:uncharacterized protein n=1 Tax=Cadophora gregata TaxID=51156 RepID=UPI0026DC9698|nr:uncharacterized protein ONS95_002351 [Cadophora gregata]KAK0109670.1 hypothetical protein ONS95_002351 [Cadophora gregata]KAK0110700.1 hypothetical protein ONS96_002299 [Cadophora gregata f. sp. sojae]
MTPLPSPRNRPKPILRHHTGKKRVQFHAKTIDLETGSLAPGNAEPSKPSHPTTTQTKDSAFLQSGNKTSRKHSKTRSQWTFRRASSPYPGKISPVSLQSSLELNDNRRSRSAAQAVNALPRMPSHIQRTKFFKNQKR